SLSLNAIGGMPWSRAIHSRVAAALLNEGKAKAVAFDIVFSDSGLSESVDRRKLIFGNKEFGDYLEKMPPVVLAAAYGGWQFLDVNGKRQTRVLPIVATETRRIEQIEPPEVASFETSPDRDKPRPRTPPVPTGLIDTIDSGTRLVPAWTPSNLKIVYYHMAIQLARLYWGLPPQSLQVRDGRLEYVQADGEIRRSVPLIHGQLIEVNWFTQWKSPKSIHKEFAYVYEFAEMLKSKDPKEREAAKEYFSDGDFKDAVVLIGPVDPLLQDLAPTSLDSDAVPKVSVHGNLLKTIVDGVFLERPSRRAVYLMVIGLTIVVTTLSLAGGARALFAKIMAVLAVAIYVALAFRFFEQAHYVLPLTAPLGAALTTSFAGLVWQVIDEQKAKGRIKGMFGAYVSPQLVERMVDSGEDPHLGGHEEEITAYFSDIQGFSSFSEKLEPGRLVELMNEYLTACTDIVQEQGGTLDKYIGDAVVAMYGAPIALPDHALRACVATQQVQQRLGELRRKWREEGDKWPEIVWRMQSRIGLNSGPAIIGNMGSRTRFNYTMMGDNVNLAARMESGAKQYGVYTMVTETTRLACEKHGAGRLIFRYLDKIVVKGRSIPVPIHEVVGLTENVTDQTRECLEIYGQGIARYLAQEWDEAEALFRRSLELEPNQPGKTPGVEGNPSLTLVSRCHTMRSHPPGAGWDGVYVMKEK
ncbi:MAG: CHASE2 domain-containing protein, partial [Verrucomicrobia bacterium]|nr:CHASE2 domain-containing protein [Verrucomicrobiota bacterium]